MLALGLALVLPRATRAQQKMMPVIGFLHFASPGPSADRVADFRQGLSETGYVEGHIPVDGLEQPHAPLDRRPF